MKIHCLQHVPFEGPAGIGDWAQQRGYELTTTGLFRGDSLPAVNDLDLLIVMGGPMSIHDEQEFPWLIDEKKFVKECVSAGKRALGVCLGAQLLADVLGGRVYKGREKEIGWFPIQLRPEASHSKLAAHLPQEFEALHWHGETFDLPPGARHLASTEVCPNQAFEIDGRVLALQFHLEVNANGIRDLSHHCAGDFDGGSFVQTGDRLLGSPAQFQAAQNLLHGLLERLAGEKS